MYSLLPSSKDINKTATSGSYAASSEGWITPVGKSVLFNAYTNEHGFELYTSDGTGEGTYLLKELLRGERSGFPRGMLTKNGDAYFMGDSNDSSTAIYKTSGTKEGVKKLTPDYVFYYSGLQSYDIADNGLLFYTVINWQTFSVELWRSDGTPAGNYKLSSTAYFQNALHTVGNTALFVAGDAEHGYELWKSDGSVAGTSMVKDINPGEESSAPGGLFVYNNEVYFGAYDGTNAAFWKSDGTEEGTMLVKNIDPFWGSSPAATAQFFCISNGLLYFSAVDYSSGNGTELWKTNGTTEGTQRIKDINPLDNSASAGPFDLTDVNGTLFFTADDGVHGRELWKSDGTEEGTQLVKDITTGMDWSFLYNLVSYKGQLYFSNFGVLWSSDGSEAGTMPVDDVVISHVTVANIVVNGDQLFLAGYTYKYGWELYAGKVDADTRMITVSKVVNKEAIKAPSSFNALLYPNPVSANAKLEITGNITNVAISITDINGRQLWQSKDITAKLISLPVEKWAKGTYFVTVSNGTERKIIKLLKQ